MEWDEDIPIPLTGKDVYRDLLRIFREMPVGASKFVDLTPVQVATFRNLLREHSEPVYLTQRKCRENDINGFRLWKISNDDRKLRGPSPQPFSTRQQRAVRPGQH